MRDKARKVPFFCPLVHDPKHDAPGSCDTQAIGSIPARKRANIDDEVDPELVPLPGLVRACTRWQALLAKPTICGKAYYIHEAQLRIPRI